MRKNVFVAFAIIAVLSFAAGCSCDKRDVVYQQAPAPVVVNNPDPMTGVIAGMAIGAIMSNGMRYDGHNGYNDSRYRGPSRTIIIKEKTVVQPAVQPAPVKPAASSVIPVAPVKSVAPSNASAEAEKLRAASAVKVNSAQSSAQALQKQSSSKPSLNLTKKK